MKKGMLSALIIMNIMFLFIIGLSTGGAGGCPSSNIIKENQERVNFIKSEATGEKVLTSSEITGYIDELIKMQRMTVNQNEDMEDNPESQNIANLITDITATKLNLTEKFVDLNYEQVGFETLPCEFETWDHAIFYWYENYGDVMQSDTSLTNYYNLKFEGLLMKCDIYDKHKLERESIEIERKESNDRSSRGWYTLWLATYLISNVTSK